MKENKEYYTEELKKLPKDKMETLKYQKYYTAEAIIMFAVLASMYFLLG